MISREGQNTVLPGKRPHKNPPHCKLIRPVSGNGSSRRLGESTKMGAKEEPLGFLKEVVRELRSIRQFFHLGGEKFDFWRGDEDHAQFELTGLRNRDKREIQFEPDADVQEGDLATFQASGKRVSITEVDIVNGHGGLPFALVAKYRPEGERDPQPSQQFNFHGPAYGMFGSQQNFSFEQVVRDLDQQIEEHGGDDKDELREMVAEIERVVETQDVIPRSKFERWSELANKHAPWLLYPLGSILMGYVFGAPGGS